MEDVYIINENIKNDNENNNIFEEKVDENINNNEINDDDINKSFILKIIECEIKKLKYDTLIITDKINDRIKSLNSVSYN
jgi:hypothetical protein